MQIQVQLQFFFLNACYQNNVQKQGSTVAETEVAQQAQLRGLMDNKQ